MAVVRLVSEKQAELRTCKAAQLRADMLPPGAKKAAAQAMADEFKSRVAARVS